MPLKHARIAAFGSTCKKGRRRRGRPRAGRPPGKQGPRWSPSWGKTWDEQVTRALLTTLDENLRMIRDSVAHLKAQGLTVVFDAEHFFDGYKANADYAMACVRAASEAGADSIDLCETNGGALPHEVEGRRGRGRRASCPASSWASTATTIRAALWRTPLAAVRCRRNSGAGHGERLRRTRGQHRPASPSSPTSS